MQKFKSNIPVPPGKYTFIVPETGFRAVAYTKEELFSILLSHHRANGLNLRPDWKEIVEDRICQGLPPGWCKYTSHQGRDSSPYRECSTKGVKLLEAAKSFSKFLTQFISKGEDVYTTQEEADARSEICAKCPFNVTTGECLSCGAMAGLTKLISKLKKNYTSKYESHLMNCCRCGCSLKYLIHIKREVLNACQTEENMLSYPKWCWKRANNQEESLTELSLCQPTEN